MRFLGILLAFLLISSLEASAQGPAMNIAISKYLETVIGKKVGRGECWDLAHDALELVGADWNHQYDFGKLLDPEKDTVYPGDIVQFENVTLKYDKDNSTYTESYPHHTAIIYNVSSPGCYEIAHQNNGFSGRKVGISTLRLANRTKGKIMIYRPVKKF